MGRVLAVLAMLLSCLVADCGADPPQLQPVDTVDLSQLAPYFQATIVFLTDHTLAVGACHKAGCNVATYDLSNGSPRQMGRMNGISRHRAMLRGRDGGIVLTGVRRGEQIGLLLLDSDLRVSRWTPRIASVSPAGEEIPEGQGRLLGHAANLAAYLDQGIVRIESSDGKVLGSFDAGSSGGKSIPRARFLGKDRLLFDRGGRLDVINYNGSVLRTFKRRERDWMGDQIAQSFDGNRLLFDSFTRHVGLAQSILDNARAVSTMDMSGDGDVPNEETVRVIDTTNGKQCFKWEARARLLPAFEHHADIDPSGRFVAILTQESLAIYRLPDACAGQQVDVH